MKYLFVGAHYDDVEISCGGTLLRLVDEGNEVYLVIMTNGALSRKGSADERKTEQHYAVRFSQIKKLFTLEHEDGAVTSNGKTIASFSKILNEVDPDVVFTHYPSDSHQDHRNTAEIVKSATRGSYSLVYYNSYSSIGFMANLYVDITPYIEKKEKMLKLFESQVSKYKERGVDLIEKSNLIAKLNGYECNFTYAEGFAIENYFVKKEIKNGN